MQLCAACCWHIWVPIQFSHCRCGGPSEPTKLWEVMIRVVGLSPRCLGKHNQDNSISQGSCRSMYCLHWLQQRQHILVQCRM